MPSVIRSICCCNGQESDDDEDAIMNDTDDDHFRSNDAVDHFYVNNVSAHTTNHGTSAGDDNFRPTDEEDELLNQILETAQQNIIDVANMDGTTTPCKEDLSKAQRYADAIKQHDVEIRKHLDAASEEDLHLLFDIGQRAVEVLQQPAQPFTSYSAIREFGKRLSDALISGVQIEHKQDILVHMSFPDD